MFGYLRMASSLDTSGDQLLDFGSVSGGSQYQRSFISWTRHYCSKQQLQLRVVPPLELRFSRQQDWNKQSGSRTKFSVWNVDWWPGDRSNSISWFCIPQQRLLRSEMPEWRQLAGLGGVVPESVGEQLDHVRQQQQLDDLWPRWHNDAAESEYGELFDKRPEDRDIALLGPLGSQHLQP